MTMRVADELLSRLRGHDRLRMLTVPEVAELLAVKPRTVEEWIRKGKLRAQRLGWKIVRVPVVELERWIAEATVKARKHKPKPPVGPRGRPRKDASQGGRDPGAAPNRAEVGSTPTPGASVVQDEPEPVTEGSMYFFGDDE